MITNLYKRTAIGLYEYEIIFSNTSSGPIIESRYGLYGSRKITNYTKGNLSKYNTLVAKKRREGYRTLKDLGIGDSNIPVKEIIDYLPEYTTDLGNVHKPMKCQPFVADKFVYINDGKEAVGQPKINGNRGTILWGKTDNGLFSIEEPILKSHDGIVLNIEHIKEAFKVIYSKVPKDVVFDGEFYVYGEHVTSISGACRNPKNPIHQKINYHCFDLAIPDVDQLTRLALKHTYLKQFYAPGFVFKQIHPSQHKECSDYVIVDVCDSPVRNDNEASELRDLCLEYSYEGCVIRNPIAEYKFGSRPVSMMKLKRPKYGYFEVIDIILYGFDSDNKNNVGKGCKFILKNDLTNEKFESNPTGTVEQKLEYYNNRKDYIGSKVMVKYYERTKNKLPFHHNVIINHE